MGKRSRVRSASALCLGAALAAGLCGCADLRRVTSMGEDGVNVESPTAPLALAASHAKFPYPNFRQVPAKPKDVRPAAAFKVAVGEEKTARTGLESWVASNPAMTSGGEAFAGNLRRKVGEPGAKPVVDQSAEAAAYAQRLRDTAKPPQPLKPSPQ